MATIGWVTDKYPHYRLSKEVVQSFLKGKFGDNGKYRESDFEVRVSREVASLPAFHFSLCRMVR